MCIDFPLPSELGDSFPFLPRQSPVDGVRTSRDRGSNQRQGVSAVLPYSAMSLRLDVLSVGLLMSK